MSTDMSDRTDVEVEVRGWRREVRFTRSVECPGDPERGVRCDYMATEFVKADDWARADGFCTKCGKTWSTPLTPGSRQALEAIQEAQP